MKIKKQKPKNLSFVLSSSVSSIHIDRSGFLCVAMTGIDDLGLLGEKTLNDSVRCVAWGPLYYHVSGFPRSSSRLVDGDSVIVGKIAKWF